MFKVLCSFYSLRSRTDDGFLVHFMWQIWPGRAVHKDTLSNGFGTLQVLEL